MCPDISSIATIFPLMSEQESAALAEDILKNGLREPILTFNNQIVDGRNRYLTCKKLGIEPRYIEWDGTGS